MLAEPIREASGDCFPFFPPLTAARRARKRERALRDQFIKETKSSKSWLGGSVKTGRSTQMMKIVGRLASRAWNIFFGWWWKLKRRKKRRWNLTGSKSTHARDLNRPFVSSLSSRRTKRSRERQQTTAPVRPKRTLVDASLSLLFSFFGLYIRISVVVVVVVELATIFYLQRPQRSHDSFLLAVESFLSDKDETKIMFQIGTSFWLIRNDAECWQVGLVKGRVLQERSTADFLSLRTRV